MPELNVKFGYIFSFESVHVRSACKSSCLCAEFVMSWGELKNDLEVLVLRADRVALRLKRSFLALSKVMSCVALLSTV